jgi:SagB-type dehydrogenase family enzyme
LGAELLALGSVDLKKVVGAVWAVVIGLCLLAGGQTVMSQTKPISQHILELPEPECKGRTSLEEALAARRSVREFTGQPITDRELSQLLWAAQGITSSDGRRTAPSAGALYPLEVWVATASGFYHYEPHKHRLTQHFERDLRPDIYRSALMQEAILQAPAIFVIAAVYQRMAQKYGEQRTPRYVHMEVGHSAQNLLLEAVALGLGGVVIGAFYDKEVEEVLSLPDDQKPLYLIPVGHPR